MIEITFIGVEQILCPANVLNKPKNRHLPCIYYPYVEN